MPHSRRVPWLALLSVCVACDVYDDALTGPLVGQGGTPADACASGEEICNGRDDDCDGVIDEETAVSADCTARFHAIAACETGLCVKTGLCDTGYFNCDGKPDNGCESTCACQSCQDTSDAGPSANGP
jgi:hypothetical protein